MIDSTPAASGAVVDECPARPPQPVVEADAGGQAEEACEDALAQARQGARPVALEKFERDLTLAAPRIGQGEGARRAVGGGQQVRAKAPVEA